MKTIYAIVGDDYHAEASIRESLNEAVAPLAADGTCRLEYTSAEKLLELLPTKPAAVILFKEDRVNPREALVRTWLTDEVSEAISRYVEEGGSFLAWHSGLASYPVDSALIRMLRGYFEHHPSKHQIVHYTGHHPAEPAAQTAFDILDEHYFVHCDEADTSVFLRSESVDGSSIGGWSHEFGQGRVCCLTPAHNKEGLLHPDMIGLLRSSVQYCLG